MFEQCLGHVTAMLLLLLAVLSARVHADTEKFDKVWVPGPEGMEQPSLFNGDIVLDPNEMAQAKAGKLGENPKYNVDKNRDTYGSVTYGRWPMPIHYKISNAIAGARSVILKAIAHYHKHTCIKFVPWDGRRRNYIYLTGGGGCSSPVGMQRSYNRVTLGRACWNTGTIAHEIGHSLGLFHEQSRPDRDRYVRIDRRYIMRGMGYNFDIQRGINSLGTPYDLRSMMHYSSTAFANVRGGKTILTKDRSKQHLIDTYNRISGFSPTDIVQLNKMYKCKGGTKPKPEPPRPKPNPGCDNKSKWCEYWRCEKTIHRCKINYCKHKDHDKWMAKNCCKACGGVRPPPEEVCEDKNNMCSSWAQKGECNANPDWMHPNCKKSCRKCASMQGAPSAETCGNSDLRCGYWAKRNQCLLNPIYMQASCRKACGYCV